MRIRALVASAPIGVLAALLIPAQPASAHPLGNFSVNEYVGLTVRPDRVDARAVVDFAEIPTLQDRSTVDADGDGTVTSAERSAHATATCADVGTAVSTSTGGQSLVWTVGSGQFTYSPGAGGLDVSRLSCELTAPATMDGPTELRVDNRYLADRVGWREMTATGDGVHLVDSPLPTTSVTNELRDYPQDLLSSALDLRSATIRVEPGAGDNTGASVSLTSGGDPLSRWMAALDRRFADLAGGPNLTPWVGVLAVLLAIVLGAGHAVLPGHGKTVLAAYLAGKRGRPRDALVVAGTVTATHTGGVLILGLVLTAGTALAGERILAWLGLVSGAIVIGVGATMLYGLIRRRSPKPHEHAHSHHGHAHNVLDQDHSHDAHPHEDHAHDGHSHDAHSHEDHALDGHSHEDHSHGDHGRRGRGHGHSHHGRHGHGHGLGHGHGRRTGRLGLAGIGLAGGLVPSPSALVVLLAAIGLGRTGFGVLLVIAYGIGMAGTLTGAGLLLVALQARMARAPGRGRLAPRVARVVERVNAATPAATAALVVLVGSGLALRAAAGVL